MRSSTKCSSGKFYEFLSHSKTKIGQDLPDICGPFQRRAPQGMRIYPQIYHRHVLSRKFTGERASATTASPYVSNIGRCRSPSEVKTTSSKSPSSYHERQPKRCLQDEKKLVKNEEVSTHGKRPSATRAPWVSIEDGNADKEAEVLIPSPNFYVLSGLFKGKMNLKGFFLCR